MQTKPLILTDTIAFKCTSQLRKRIERCAKRAVSVSQMEFACSADGLREYEGKPSQLYIFENACKAERQQKFAALHPNVARKDETK